MCCECYENESTCNFAYNSDVCDCSGSSDGGKNVEKTSVAAIWVALVHRLLKASPASFHICYFCVFLFLFTLGIVTVGTASRLGAGTKITVPARSIRYSFSC